MFTKRSTQSTVSLLPFIGATIFLALLGLLWVFEASVAESYALFEEPYHFVKQHALGLIIGGIALIVATFIPTKLWLKYAMPLFLFGLLLLILVLIPGLGTELNGARSWFFIAGISVQPIELYKFIIIVYLSSWLAEHQRILPFLAIVGITSLLVMLQPDLGSLLIVLSIAFSMYFFSGANLKSFLSIISCAVLAVITLAVSSPYRMERLTTFFDPTSDPLDSSFQIRQITLALGRGGWFGQGIGNSKQRFSYIPEASTDSIFSIIAEEIGFVGSLAMIALFVFFIVYAIKIVSLHQEKAIKLLGYGIITWISVQTILNLGAVVGLLPLTGIPLPFFSYGRSSLIMLLFSTGILIRIGKES